MPLGKNVKYRYKKGTNIRLAFKGGKVIEAKNMKTGDVHTPAEFAKDRAKSMHKHGHMMTISRVKRHQ